MADEVVFQNDPVDPSGEFDSELRWKRMALAQRVSYHEVTLQLEDFQLWEDAPPAEYRQEQSWPFELRMADKGALGGARAAGGAHSYGRGPRGHRLDGAQVRRRLQATGELDWDRVREWRPPV
jgi:hypothetical protein